MALSIKDPEADRLARELAELTGESLTQAVTTALRERLLRQTGRNHARRLSDDLREIRESLRGVPVLDPRTPEEIIGYDDDGLPR